MRLGKRGLKWESARASNGERRKDAYIKEEAKLRTVHDKKIDEPALEWEKL
jgi:hypothetical protein